MQATRTTTIADDTRPRQAPLVGLLVLGILAGCSAEQPQDGGGSAGVSVAKRKSRRADLLLSVMEITQPKKLGIETKRQTVAELLNDWVSLGGDKAGQAGAVDEAYTSRLSEPRLKRLAEPRYSRRDVGHLRNAIWYKQVSGLATQNATDDLSRVVGLFEYVVRNVALRSEEETELPLAPFAIAMLGEGNPRDRAWLFANLVRQLRYDSVVLVCGEDPEAWLHGVLMGEDVVLFDFRLGMPIPVDRSDPAAAVISQPATLKQVLADPKLLKGLAGDAQHAYPVTAESLKEAQVKLVGTTCFWSTRMKRLQMALSGQDALLLWDPLESSDEVPKGQLARVVAAGFSAERIGIWDYPEDRLDANAVLDSSQIREFRRRSRAFSAPVPIAQIIQNPETQEVKIVMGPPQYRLRKSRNQQLLGSFDKALPTYLSIRLWRDAPPVPKQYAFISRDQQSLLRTMLKPAVREIHEEAADDASFWVAICQLEQGGVAKAVNSLTGYRERSGPHEWAGAALWLEALCLARLDKFTEAIALLETVEDKDPHWAGSQVLLRRWKKLAPDRPQAPAKTGPGRDDAKKSSR